MKVIAAALCGLVSTACASGSPSTRGPEALRSSSPGIEVRHVRGLDASRVRALVTPSLPSLHECASGSGGKINVEITLIDGAIHVAIEPGLSLNPLLRECVLQALSTIDVEEIGGDTPGVSVRPGGFTSLVAISW